MVVNHTQHLVKYSFYSIDALLKSCFTAGGVFLVQQIGESVMLTCSNSSLYTYLEWELNDLQNVSLSESTQGIVLVLDPVLDTHHDHDVICRRFIADSESSNEIPLSIVVSGEAEPNAKSNVIGFSLQYLKTRITWLI